MIYPVETQQENITVDGKFRSRQTVSKLARQHKLSGTCKQHCSIGNNNQSTYTHIQNMRQDGRSCK